MNKGIGELPSWNAMCDRAESTEDTVTLGRDQHSDGEDRTAWKEDNIWAEERKQNGVVGLAGKRKKTLKNTRQYPFSENVGK